MTETGRLDGRVAVVTGASSGIGRAIAIALAAEGAVLILADIREEPVEGGVPTAAEITSRQGSARHVRLDLADVGAVEGLVAEVVEQHGRLDIVVNNAATYVSKPLLETTVDEWDLVQAVNVRAVFVLCRAAVAQMITQPPTGDVRGRIVNIGSQHGIVAAPLDIAYGTSKSAVMYMTRQIATDYAAKGIVCNCVAPGKIFTGKGGRELDPDWQASWQARTPWPRPGRPEDVAAAVLFLASGDASFTTGATLMVDGGWSAS
jgi:NAD(P)-dependent dehydrogenase (short-subunit alcohol dehydrogenase family)